MKKKERDTLIGKIAHASGVAKYAIEDRITNAKMSEDDLIKLSQNLDILQLIKPANTYNRNCQAKKTEDANAKLKEFINPDNSEIIKAGKWLFSALGKKGEERKEHLLEKDLVHKDNYNDTLEDLKDVNNELRQALKNQTEMARGTISLLEQKNDELRKQLENIEAYIINNSGINKWDEIKKYLVK
jgi:hypothetical protein